MPARKKGAVRKGHGTMCNICGLNCGKGAALSKHVKGAHGVEYASYVACFYPDGATVVADSWDASITTADGSTVVTHVLVRRLAGDPGKRGVTRAARVREVSAAKPARVKPTAASAVSGSRTQRVTAVDLGVGRIRIPTDTMALFPRTAGRIQVVIREIHVSASWNPRMGAAKRRSGELYVGKELLNRLIEPGEVLKVIEGTDPIVLR